MELLIGEHIKSYTRLKIKDLTRHLSPWVRFQLDSAQAHVKKTQVIISNLQLVQIPVTVRVLRQNNHPQNEHKYDAKGIL